MLDRSLSLMAELTETINSFLMETDPHHKPLSTQDVAMGFIAVANESMSRPIRALTQVLLFTCIKCCLYLLVYMY